MALELYEPDLIISATNLADESAADIITVSTGVASGTFWNALNLMVSLPLGILSFGLVSHVLGPPLMGRYNFLVWLNSTMVGLLVGNANAATKWIAELRSQKQDVWAANSLRWLLKLQIIMGCVLLALAILATLWLRPTFWLEYLLPTGAAVVSLVGGVLVGANQAVGRFRALAFNNIAFALLQFALVILCLMSNWQVEGLLWVLFVSSLFYLMLNWWSLQQTKLLTHPRLQLPPALRRQIWGYLWSIAGAFALGVVVWQDSETLLLKIFSSDAEISYYSAAFVLASRLILLPDLVFAAFLPVVCSLYARSDFAQLGLLHRQTLRYLLLLSTPLAVGGIALARPIISLFDGSNFAPAALPLVLLLLSGLLITPGKLAVAILMAANDSAFIRNLTIVAAGLNMGLAVAFVAIGWGAFGAALASVLAQLGVIVTITRAAQLSRHPFPWVLFVKTIAVAGLAFGPVALLLPNQNWLGLILSGSVGLVIYLGLLPLFGLVTPDDWRQIVGRFTTKNHE